MIKQTMQRSQNALHQWVQWQIHPCYYSIFRIVYALVAGKTALETLPFISFIWYGSPPLVIQAYTALNMLWLGACLLLLVGRFSKLAAAICLIATPLCFDSSVGGTLLKMGAFWMLWMPLEQQFSLGKPDTTKDSPAWPAFLLGLNVNIIMCFAGISKAMDPVWRHGWGLYYTLLEPWIQVHTWDWLLLNNKPLLIVGNYGGLLLELLVLPLFLIAQTRLLSVLLLAAFFITLTYPIRIDPIGPVGLALCIPLLALCPAFNQLLAKYIPLITAPRKEVLVREKIVAASLCGLVTLMALVTFLRWAPKRLEYPTAMYPYHGIHAKKEGLPNYLLRKAALWIRPVYNATKELNLATIHVSWFSPFNLYHFLGRYGYKVVVHLNDGTIVEPVKLFNSDNSTGPDSQGFLTPSILKNRAWNVGHLCQKLGLNATYKPSAEETLLLQAISAHVVQALPQSSAQQVHHVAIWVNPSFKPVSFQKDFFKYPHQDWQEIFHLSPSLKDVLVVNRPKKWLPVLDLPEFKNGLIVYDPTQEEIKTHREKFHF